MKTGMNKNDLAAFGFGCIGLVIISIFALDCGYIPTIEKDDTGRIALSFSRQALAIASEQVNEQSL